MSILTPRTNFSALSLTDLLEARDLYHNHLIHKENVIATAVGKYLIRKNDPRPEEGPSSFGGKKSAYRPVQKSKRTLENSEVRDYSWPCILVFVDQWVQEEQFGLAVHPEEMLPKRLYLPDGRMAPICIVEAARTDAVEAESPRPVFPDNFMGGGYPLLSEIQGVEHFATAACLVSDGHSVFALTNRHVAGAPGKAIYSVIGGLRSEVGVASEKQLTRRSFTEVYDGFAGKHVFLNLDVGLVEIAERSRWTAQVYGIGQIGELADLSVANLSLDLIGAPVLGNGAASGLQRGSIHALFYRYKSIAGSEFVADFLIGPRGEDRFITNPGDSGRLLLLELAEGLPMPIALQWGGHIFLDDTGAGQRPYALATSLSSVCNLLEVELIRDWNIGQTAYWGEMGHYTVGAKACEILSDPSLRKLMMANHDRIGFPDDSLRDPSKYQRHSAKYRFVPLADVADNVWRTSRPEDGNNHFADMDKAAGPGPFKGKTLLEICQAEKNVKLDVWVDYYKSIHESRPGALPFRVWQIYKAMVDYLRASGGPDLTGFVCAAGCLAHYVGDACQPLHVSQFHHNLPDFQTNTGRGIHSVYETTMLNDHAREIVNGLNQKLQGVQVNPTFDGKGGKGAAIRVIELMRKTIGAIPPQNLCDAYNEAKTPSARVNRLWADFGGATITSLKEGVVCLADIWESAWKEGGSPQLPNHVEAIPEQDLIDLYNKQDFIISKPLGEMGPLL